MTIRSYTAPLGTMNAGGASSSSMAAPDPASRRWRCSGECGVSKPPWLCKVKEIGKQQAVSTNSPLVIVGLEKDTAHWNPSNIFLAARRDLASCKDRTHPLIIALVSTWLSSPNLETSTSSLAACTLQEELADSLEKSEVRNGDRSAGGQTPHNYPVDTKDNHQETYRRGSTTEIIKRMHRHERGH